MENEALSVKVPAKVYLDLVFQLRKNGDLRAPDEVVALAIRHWLSSRCGRPWGLGYQWRDLFLPDGTDLRMRYRGAWHYAKVQGDQLLYVGEPVLSPREWALLVTGTVRNPWRDVWIRKSVSDAWSRAADCRAAPVDPDPQLTGERRRQSRRSTD